MNRVEGVATGGQRQQQTEEEWSDRPLLLPAGRERTCSVTSCGSAGDHLGAQPGDDHGSGPLETSDEHYSPQPLQNE